MRVLFYKLRKKHMIEEMTKRTSILEAKARFVEMVCAEQIKVFRQTVAHLNAQITQHQFPTVDGTHDYLLNIKTYQYTMEHSDKLKHEAAKTRAELVELQKMTVTQLWQNNLSEL
jgi:DNA topoisomerase-2